MDYFNMLLIALLGVTHGAYKFREQGGLFSHQVGGYVDFLVFLAGFAVSQEIAKHLTGIEVNVGGLTFKSFVILVSCLSAGWACCKISRFTARKIYVTDLGSPNGNNPS